MMRVWGTVAVLALVAAMGCTPQTEVVHPPTYAVTGVVTYNGDPVEGAQVAFVAAGGGQGAAGTTDADGKYTLTTYEAGDGAEAGEYGVKIMKFSKPPKAEGGGEEEYTGAAEDDAWVPTNELPAKYADPSTSGLTATVGESATTADFELKD